MGNYYSYCPSCFHKTKPLGVLCVCDNKPFYPDIPTPQRPAVPVWNNKAMIPKTTSGINEKQVGGNHYKLVGIQPWDYITSNNMGFLEGCIIKYVSRYQDKGGLEDLKKAQHFLEKLIEVQSNG